MSLSSFIAFLAKINLPLIFFLAIILLYLIGAIFISYHLLKFGIGKEPKILNVVFLIGSLILIALNFFYFYSVNWEKLIKEIFG